MMAFEAKEFLFIHDFAIHGCLKWAVRYHLGDAVGQTFLSVQAFTFVGQAGMPVSQSAGCKELWKVLVYGKQSHTIGPPGHLSRLYNWKR